MASGEQNTGFFIPLAAGILLLAGAALLVFVVPLVEDPRPRKPISGGWKTTVWDKWTVEHRSRQIREAYEEQLRREKQEVDGHLRDGSP